jgi:hypothetical protein
MRLTPVISKQEAQAAPNFIEAFCFSIDQIGRFVYILGDKVGGIYQVATVDITSPLKMPAVGVIISKPSATECIVQMSGLVVGLYNSLTPGSLIMPDTNGAPSHSVAYPSTGLRILQVVGLAVSSEDFRFMDGTPTKLRPIV